MFKDKVIKESSLETRNKSTCILLYAVSNVILAEELKLDLNALFIYLFATVQFPYMYINRRNTKKQ